MTRLALGRSLLGVLMLLRVPALRAQQSDSILKAQLENGMYPPKDARAILAVLSDAEARRLPTDGLELRVRDGVAHNVDAGRTIGVVRGYLASLIEARRTLGPAASATELEYGATALALHMPIAAFRTIGSARSSLGGSLPLARARGSSVLSAYRLELGAIRSAHRLPQPRPRLPTGASVD
jgi:hypothetical protein